MERWAAIAGYEGLYEVSDHGRVRSLPRRDRIGHPWKGRELKPAVGRRGYLYVTLSRGGVAKSLKVHRLVAEAFVTRGQPDQTHVNHIDLCTSNNHWLNLEWVTPQQNIRHAAAHGRFSALLNPNVRQSLTPCMVRAIKADIAAGQLEHKEIAAKHGVSLKTVERIRFGTHWTTPAAVNVAGLPDHDALVGLQGMPLKSIKVTAEILANVLHDLRILRLPQRTIAARHGVSASTVSRLNRGVVPRTLRSTQGSNHVKA